VSGRGSVFFLCRRADTDPAFSRYPRLPRLACSGHELSGVTEPGAPDAMTPERDAADEPPGPSAARGAS